MIRLALGTVQFGLDYGVANLSGQVGQSEVAAILNRAAAAASIPLDTAIAYGQSEAVLGRAGVKNWRVITKLPPLPQEVTAVPGWIDDQIDGSLRRLGITQLEAVLLHRGRDLLGRHGEDYLQALMDMKAAGLTRALGVSVYDPSELDVLWPIWRPDVVQAPCNVLDRRLVRSGWLDRLNQNKVRVQVRSAFLQGVYCCCHPSVGPKALHPGESSSIVGLRGAMVGVSRRCGARWHLCVSLRGVEFVVVGVDSSKHLEEVLALSAVAEPLPPDDLFSEDRDLIDPSRWKVA